VEQLRKQPGVSGVVSYLELRDSIFLGNGGGTFVLVGLQSTDAPVESLVPMMHQQAHLLEDQLRGAVSRGEAATYGRDSPELRHPQSERR
jgi:RND superfamily putative drug exporter